mmetsp:Transcript_14874/g.19510  ORF Transcript_14874/g.19510 Transcript_14874/m.19510 type:complete len:1026 (-) Transcript_14874:204-3281(-)
MSFTLRSNTIDGALKSGSSKKQKRRSLAKDRSTRSLAKERNQRLNSSRDARLRKKKGDGKRNTLGISRAFSSVRIDKVFEWKPFSSKSKRGTAHSGWLWLQVENGWTKCWFILDGSTLSLHDHNSRDESDGDVAAEELAAGTRIQIKLTKIAKVELEKGSKEIKLTLKGDKKTLTLKAKSRKDAKGWCIKLHMLREQMKALKQKQGKADTAFTMELGSRSQGSFDMISTSGSIRESLGESASRYGLSSTMDRTNSMASSATSNSSTSRVDSISQADFDIKRGSKDESSKKTPESSQANGFATLGADLGDLGYTPGRAQYIEKVDDITNVLQQKHNPKHSFVRRKSVMPLIRESQIDDNDMRMVKSAGTSEFLKQVLGNTASFMSNLVVMDKNMVNQIVEKMYKVKTKVGQNLVTEGSLGDIFYIVEHGKFNILKQTDLNDGTTYPDSKGNLVQIVATKGKGAYFGELALLYDQPSPISVQSLSKGTVWALNRAQFKEIREAINLEQHEEKEAFLEKLGIDEELLGGSENLANLADSLERHVSNAYEIVVRPETEIREMIFVVEGKIHIYDSNDELVHDLEPGDSFGEVAMLQKYVSEYKLVTTDSDSDTIYLTFDVEDFNGLVGTAKKDFLNKLKDRDFTMQALKKDRQVQENNLARGELPNRKSRKSSFQEALLDLPWKESPPLLMNLQFGDLTPLKKLGAGTFGHVYLVKNERAEPLLLTDTTDQYAPNYFALKAIPLGLVERNGWERNVENELNAMKELSYYARSPFLIDCYHTYADKNYIYFLIHLADGGDLFQYLSERREGVILSEKNTAFYIACVLSGLAAIHSRLIIYRDLKPENLMVAQNGFVKIADFGFAKKTVRTMTVCGTSDYMTPEVILSKGHGETVDFWALGVLVYELTHGRSPFQGASAMNTYKNILSYHAGKSDIVFENPYVTDSLKNIVHSLCHPKTLKRYFVIGKKIDAYRDHEFFEDFDWNQFDNLEMDAPFFPPPQDLVYETLSPMSIKSPNLKRGKWKPRVDTTF